MKLVIIAVILLMTVSGVSAACGRAEYLIGHECCPMCSPGYYVRRHCTEFFSTRCLPCRPSFYTDTLNSLEYCRRCTLMLGLWIVHHKWNVYNSIMIVLCSNIGGGLRVKRACSSTSDTLCEPLEGHYCTDPIQDGCRGAVEHTKCSPGQYINQTGTSSSDTVCGECVGDTYSNGSFTSCRPHTQCELMRLVVIRKGSTSYDTACAERKDTAAIVVGVVAVVLVCGVLAGLFILRRKRRKQQVTTQPELGWEKDLLEQKLDPAVTTEVIIHKCLFISTFFLLLLLPV
ncbi:tumor necrosis factor receptor superfamily member 14-like [Sardina pilchardus]|uniref:tumor necrosis factor receptor superfamily member 14-like n=1 Tax=Sardina pilchardus TaxID=27697 RepID=UPI002E15CDE0